MSVDIGIIGLPKSGKTTIFNALTRGTAETGGYAQEAHIGVTKVPEPRLNALAEMLHPKRVVPAEVRYIDIGASVKDVVKDKIGGQLLNQLSNVDALINVIRAFRDDSIPHPEGNLDVSRDIAAMTLELTFSDLILLERRLEKVDISLKGAKAPERQILLHEQEFLNKLKAGLEKDIPLREMSLSTDEVKAISSYQFLTAKPILIVVNIGEEQISDALSMEASLGELFAKPGCRLTTLCGKLESELGQLDESEAASFRTDFGMTESGLDRVITLSYGLLGLITFFTTASAEVKAWPVSHGAEAPRAAGKIHSDMERGFIRAEVIAYEDLVKCGSLTEAHKKGLVRLEGKTYAVQDGDVITFLFNV